MAIRRQNETELMAIKPAYEENVNQGLAIQPVHSLSL